MTDAVLLPSVDAHPSALAHVVDGLSLPELVQLGERALSRMLLLAESPGLKLKTEPTAHTKPSASAPRATPSCTCGCPSRRDHWQRELDKAFRHDADPANDGRRRMPGAVLRAVCTLWDARHRPDIKIDQDGHTDAIGPERDDRILSDYEGLTPERAADLETGRAGYCTPEAIKRTRRANGRRMDNGEPAADPAELTEDILRLRYSTVDGKTPSVRQIAVMLGVGKGTVERVVAKHDSPAVAA